MAELNISDEKVYRAMARKLVSDISIEELCRLFRFEKIDPRSTRFEEILNKKSNSLSKRAELAKLHTDQGVMYTAEIKI